MNSNQITIPQFLASFGAFVNRQKPRHYFVIFVVSMVLFSYLYMAAENVNGFAPGQALWVAVRVIWRTWTQFTYGLVVNLALYGGFIIFCQCWLRNPEPDSGFFVLAFGTLLTPWSLFIVDYLINRLAAHIGHHPLL